MDLGFCQAGFHTSWANEYDSSIWETFEENFPKTYLNRNSIVNVASKDIEDGVGIVGGPPCQSWSEAGVLRGIKDHRGKLFYEYIRVLNDKKPLFFLAENVSGILMDRHRKSFNEILKRFSDAGYKVTYKLLNAYDYGVAQDRKRVIIVGYRHDLGKEFIFPEKSKEKIMLKDVIKKMGKAKAALDKNHANPEKSLFMPNHEYIDGSFSSIYMSRNRVRSWDEPSFTIQAGGRHAPIHPQAPKMIQVGKDKRIFALGKNNLYRRLSVRECARIQTFPDDFIFKYRTVLDGYKMVGNAVPVKLAKRLAEVIMNDIRSIGAI